MDPGANPDPFSFEADLQGVKKKNSTFFCFFLLEGTFTSFFKEKNFIKKSEKSRN